jgi:hypothetical protein
MTSKTHGIGLLQSRERAGGRGGVATWG